MTGREQLLKSLPPPLPPKERDELVASCVRARDSSSPDYVAKRTQLAESMVRMLYGLASNLAPHCPEPDAFHALVSEGTLALIKAIDTWKPDGGSSIVSWCRFKAFKAMLTFVNSWFGLSGPLPLDELALQAEDEDPSEWAIRGEEAQLLHEALDRLPERYRQVLYLRYFQDCTYTQIGAQLGVTRQRAQQLAQEATNRLTIEFEKRSS